MTMLFGGDREEFLEESGNLLTQLLQDVLDDATGDIDHPEKRIWPIRAELYRQIAKKIGYKHDSERAMKKQRVMK